MKLYMKQKIFSLLDSYKIFNEFDEVEYYVKSELSWSHSFQVYDKNGICVGKVKQEIFTLLPKFYIYKDEERIGSVSKELKLFNNNYRIDYKDWYVEGDIFEWDYSIYDRNNSKVATVEKEIWNFSDTYSIYIENEKDKLDVLMFVLAIDAENCQN